MKRTIKFRGKTEQGEWLYGSYVHYTKSDVAEHCILSKGKRMLSILPETVGQLTGHFDGKNKEIYEGDIIAVEVKIEKREDYQLLTTKQLYELFPENFFIDIIKWDNVEMCFTGTMNGYIYYDVDGNLHTHCGRRVEIVGNIHDNPELLTQKSE